MAKESYTLTLRQDQKVRCIEVMAGSKLGESIRGFTDLQMPCGGAGTCGKCKVRISGAKLAEPTSSERRFLSATELADGYRLACSAVVQSAMTVDVPEPATGMQIQLESQFNADSDSTFDITPDTGLYTCRVSVDEPCLEDQRADDMRLLDAIGEPSLSIDLSLLRTLHRALQEGERTFCVVHDRDRLLSLTAGDVEQTLLGFAIDIGTTTLAVYLYDLVSGRQIAEGAAVNVQRSFGADVISRIQYSMEHTDGLHSLAESVRRQLHTLCVELLTQQGYRLTDIYASCIVANTSMLHFLMELPASSIAVAPFLPVLQRSVCLSSAELDLPFAGYVFIPPSLSAYIGADISAGILACGMHEREELSLLVDIGTNGEMALGNRDGFVTCSTAAGPAFEGANISQGMSAVRGAICNVDLGTTARVRTIGDAPALGICGSGVLDAFAQLYQHGIVDETGRMLEKEEIEDEVLAQDLVFLEGKGLAFRLTPGDGVHPPVYFSQRDVREVQLAKAAIRAGIETLLRGKAVHYDEIDRIYLAGGFGNYLSQEAAICSGLLPAELAGRIVSVGNAAGKGSDRSPSR